MRDDYFSDIRDLVTKISEGMNGIGPFFIDKDFEDVGAQRVDHWKVLMGIFAHVGGRNLLAVGNPGSGKTSYATIINSLVTALPYDLFDFLKIQGHPEQTHEKMIGRPDLGKLDVEGVVWHPSIHLPGLTLDELNRLPPGKQAILMEFIRTGWAEYLGKYFTTGKIPYFAT